MILALSVKFQQALLERTLAEQGQAETATAARDQQQRQWYQELCAAETGVKPAEEPTAA